MYAEKIFGIDVMYVEIWYGVTSENLNAHVRRTTDGHAAVELLTKWLYDYRR